MELEWKEFFPDFFEADILDERLFVNWNTKGLHWEFAVGQDVKFVNVDKTLVLGYAQVWANHYFKANRRFGD